MCIHLLEEILVGRKKGGNMSDKLEINFNSDSQVALKLFNRYVASMGEEECTNLFKDKEKLLGTIADFVYVVKHPHLLKTIKRKS